MYVRTYVCIYIYVCMYICIYIYICMYVCICICIYVYVYVYIYMCFLKCIYIYTTLGNLYHSKPYHTHWLFPLAPAAWRNTLCGAAASSLSTAWATARHEGTVGTLGSVDAMTTQSENQTLTPSNHNIEHYVDSNGSSFLKKQSIT